MKISLSKTLKVLLLIPIMLVSAFAVLNVTPVYAVANLSLSPATQTDTCTPPPPGTGCTNGLGMGNTFQYSVTASGFLPTTIFAFQYEIHYNPTIIQALSVDSFGPFFDLLISISSCNGQCAIPVSSIDNTAGVVSIAASSVGPQSPSFVSNLVLGVVTFNVTGLGRSDESLSNAILLHNVGGGILSNIPVTTTGGIFSNVGFFGFADFPSVSSGLRQAWPEEVEYSVVQDNAFTPGIVDLFGNVNSTGTLSVKVYIQFTVTSSDLGITKTVTTPAENITGGQVSVVPLVTGYDPNPGGSGLQVGTFDVVAKLFYQQINLGGTLGPLTQSPTEKPFHFTVIPGNPTTTSVSCSPMSGVTRRTRCTAVVGASDQSHLNGVVSFKSNIPGIFKPLSCAVDNKGICSVRFYPRDGNDGIVTSHDATVTASYSGDTAGKGGHAGSSGSTIVNVTGHNTTLVVTCSPGTVNAPKRTTSTCTATVTDTSGAPDNVTGSVIFKSDHASYWDFAQLQSGVFIFPTCNLVPISTGVSSCTITYKPTRSNNAVCNPTTGCMATISASYAVSNRPSVEPGCLGLPHTTVPDCQTTVGDSTLPDGTPIFDADHLTSQTTTMIGVTGHQTRTRVTCSPGAIAVNMTTTCTVTVADIDHDNSVTPAGIVLFLHGGGTGGFSPDSCVLSPTVNDTSTAPFIFRQAKCSVSFTVGSTATTTSILGLYRGDTIGAGHVRTSGVGTVKVFVP